jgi:hypothetical protein
MRRSCNILLWALVAIAAVAPSGAGEVFPAIHDEPITVRIVDGKAGKPQPKMHILLVAGYNRRDLTLGLWKEEAVTDGAGTVHLSDSLRNLPLLQVAVLKRRACEPDMTSSAWSVERIRRDGLSSANRCGAFTFPDAPGVFTVFVKAPKEKKPKPAPAVAPPNSCGASIRAAFKSCFSVETAPVAAPAAQKTLQ